MDLACSWLITMSTMRCCSAWNAPMGTPNCLRVLMYSSVASLAYFMAPTASAHTSAVAKSTTSSMRGNASPSPMRTAAADLNVTSAAGISSRVR